METLGLQIWGLLLFNREPSGPLPVYCENNLIIRYLEYVWNSSSHHEGRTQIKGGHGALKTVTMKSYTF